VFASGPHNKIRGKIRPGSIFIMETKMKKYCAGDQAIYNYYTSFEKKDGHYHVIEDEGSLMLEKTYDAPTKKEFLEQMMTELIRRKFNQNIINILQDVINDTPEGI
jgi:hypothetical protein